MASATVKVGVGRGAALWRLEQIEAVLGVEGSAPAVRQVDRHGDGEVLGFVRASHDGTPLRSDWRRAEIAASGVAVGEVG